jgi:ADP-ribose pyrophosphatase YjhB (NUDIX family)
MSHLRHYNSKDKVLVAVDCVIFGFDNTGLKILLIKRAFEPQKGDWSLMGGFLSQEETLDQAAKRVLNELTGLDNIYMKQVYSYSVVDRDPLDRTISVAFFSLINIKQYDFKLNKEHHAHWFGLSEAPTPIFDHQQMITEALERLKREALSNPIGFELLPEKFTMRQLQDLYESIFNQKLDKRNFINKINALDILIRLEEKDKSTSKKGAYLYRFDEKKYNLKKEDGFIFKL